MRRIVIVLSIAALPAAAHGDVLLTVDITSPTAVVISSTGGAASASISGVTYKCQLDGSIVSGTNSSYPLTGNLASSLGDAVYGSVLVRSGTALSPGNFGGQTLTFTAGQQAFTGAGSANLSDLTFAPVGTVGDIRVLNNFGGDTGVIVGQYRIIPAPGAAVIGLTGLLALRRRR
jgi:hypothetical protein